RQPAQPHQRAQPQALQSANRRPRPCRDATGNLAGHAPTLGYRDAPRNRSLRLIPMQPIISITGLSKTYASGFEALKGIDLEIDKGEIFALLGPNGAGKTTLINIVCGIVNPGSGSVTIEGHDIVRDYRITRALIGLVPQELPLPPFETVWAAVSLSRGL